MNGKYSVTRPVPIDVRIDWPKKSNMNKYIASLENQRIYWLAPLIDGTKQLTSYPYPVREDQDGQLLTEGVDFRFEKRGCSQPVKITEGHTVWTEVKHVAENVAIPIDPAPVQSNNILSGHENLPQGTLSNRVDPVPANVEELKQDFKELNLYLDQLCINGHGVKDAGNLWIQFSDKFRAFEKIVLAASRTEPGEHDELWEEVINQVYDWHYDYGGSENGKMATENYMKSKYSITRKQ